MGSEEPRTRGFRVPTGGSSAHSRWCCALGTHSQIGLSSSRPRSHLSRHISRLFTLNSCWQPSPVAHSPQSKSPNLSDLLSLRHALPGPLHHQKEDEDHAGAHPVFCWNVAAGPGHAQLNRCCAVSMALLSGSQAPIPRAARGLSTFPPVRDTLVLCDRKTKKTSSNIISNFHSKVTSAPCLHHDVQSTLRVLPSGISAICSYLKTILV